MLQGDTAGHVPDNIHRAIETQLTFVSEYSKDPQPVLPFVRPDGHKQ